MKRVLLFTLLCFLFISSTNAFIIDVEGMYRYMRSQIVGFLTTFDWADLFDPEFYLTRGNAECCLMLGAAQGLMESIIHIDGHPQNIKNCRVRDAIGTRATIASQTSAGDIMYNGMSKTPNIGKGSYHVSLYDRCACGAAYDFTATDEMRARNHYAIQWYGGCKLCPVDSHPKNKGQIAEININHPEDFPKDRADRQALMFPACLCENNGKRVGFNAIQQRCCGPNEVFVYDDSNPLAFYGFCKQCPAGTEPDAEYGRACTSIKEMNSTAQKGGIVVGGQFWTDCYGGSASERDDDIRKECEEVPGLEYKGKWRECQFKYARIWNGQTQGLCEVKEGKNLPVVKEFQCNNNDHAVVHALSDNAQCKTCPERAAPSRAFWDKQNQYIPNYHQCMCDHPDEVFNDISGRCQTTPTTPCPENHVEGTLNGRKYCFAEYGGDNPCPDGYGVSTNTNTGKLYCKTLRAKARVDSESDYCLMGDIMKEYGLDHYYGWRMGKAMINGVVQDQYGYYRTDRKWGTAKDLEYQTSRLDHEGNKYYPHGFPRCQNTFVETNLVEYEDPCPTDYYKDTIITDEIFVADTSVVLWNFVCRKATANKRCSLGDYDAYESSKWETSTEGLKLKPCVGAGLMCSIGDLYVQRANPARSVAYTSGKVVIGYELGNIVTYNSSTSATLRTFSGHTDEVTSVAIQDSTIISASKDNTIKRWNADNGDLVNTMQGHSDEILCVAISPNGNIFASGSKDNTIKIWHTYGGVVDETLTNHTGAVLSLAFSPDGNYLVSGSADKSFRIWDVSSGAALIETVDPDYFLHMIDVDGNKVTYLDLFSAGPYNQFSDENDEKPHTSSVTGVAWRTYTEKSLIDNNGGTICNKLKHLYEEDSCHRCKYGIITHGINDWCCRQSEKDNCRNIPDSFADTTLTQIIATHSDGTVNIWNFDKDASHRKALLYTSQKQRSIQSFSSYSSMNTHRVVTVSDNQLAFWQQKQPLNKCRLINLNLDAEVTKSQCRGDPDCTLTYRHFPINNEGGELCDRRKSAFHHDSCARCKHGYIRQLANDWCSRDPDEESLYWDNLQGRPTKEVRNDANVLIDTVTIDTAYGAFCVPKILEKTIVKHYEYATGVAFSPDGNYFATGGQRDSWLWEFGSNDKLTDKLRSFKNEGVYGTQSEAGSFDEIELYEDLPDKDNIFWTSHIPTADKKIVRNPRVRTPERVLVAPVCSTQDMDQITDTIIHNGVKKHCPQYSQITNDMQTCYGLNGFTYDAVYHESDHISHCPHGVDQRWVDAPGNPYEWNEETRQYEGGVLEPQDRCMPCPSDASPDEHHTRCICENNFYADEYLKNGQYHIRCICSGNDMFQKDDGTCQQCFFAKNIDNKECVCGEDKDSGHMNRVYNYQENYCCDFDEIVHNGVCTSCPANSVRPQYDFNYNYYVDINAQIIEKTKAINACICNNGYHYDAATNQCVCTNAQNAYVSGGICVTCPSKSVASGSTCICDGGLPYDATSNECCSEDKVAFNGKCELCPEGSTVNSDQSACIPDDNMRVYNPLTNNLCPVDNFYDPSNDKRGTHVNVYAGNDAGLYGFPFPLTVHNN